MKKNLVLIMVAFLSVSTAIASELADDSHLSGDSHSGPGESSGDYSYSQPPAPAPAPANPNTTGSFISTKWEACESGSCQYKTIKTIDSNGKTESLTCYR